MSISYTHIGIKYLLGGWKQIKKKKKRKKEKKQGPVWLLAENLGSILEVNKLCEGSDGKHFGPWGTQCSHHADSSAIAAWEQVWMVPEGLDVAVLL